MGGWVGGGESIGLQSSINVNTACEVLNKKSGDPTCTIDRQDLGQLLMRTLGKI